MYRFILLFYRGLLPDIEIPSHHLCHCTDIQCVSQKRGQIGYGTGTEAARKKHEDAQEMQRHQRQAIGLVPSAHFVIVSLTPEQYSPETKDVTQEGV